VVFALPPVGQLIGVRAGEYGRQNPLGGAAANRALFELAAAGRLTPHIHARLPFTALTTAFDRLAAREVVGRIVLENDAMHQMREC
jgi:NADPH2:quinone reductase